MISLQSQAQLPTRFGNFIISAFSEYADDPMPIIVLSTVKNSRKTPLVRLHSECITGEVFGSCRCDCGPQLHRAMEMIAAEQGHLIYLRQEGRGIGIVNKIKAYDLQDKGLNTLEANIHLGFRGDEREYASAVEVLRLLNVHKLHLITNNPLKMDYLIKAGIEIPKRVPLIIPASHENEAYLNVKRDLMGHIL